MTASRTTHRNALPPGSALLWYVVERVLGQGAFGITYLATDGNLHRPVAIKEYLPGQLAGRDADASVRPLTDDLREDYESGLKRFILEARTLARFEHPAIVRVHNVFEANRTAYMVMQYEEGEGLDRLLKRRGTLTEDEILRILHPLLAGLESIHAQGFVHRDIKPANIFLRRDGSPVLLDFGSARQAVAGEARTLTNFVSPGYAPIEQYTGKSDQQGPWSDIYGLGATVYRAMTGRTPVDAVERSQSLAQDTRDSYEAGAVHAQGRYSQALVDAVDQALRFRIQDRPRDIAQWRRSLPAPPTPAIAAPDRTVPACAQVPPSPADVPTLAATIPLPPTVPVAAPTMAPTVVLAPSAPSAVPPAPGPEPARDGRSWRPLLLGVGGLIAAGIVAGVLLGRAAVEAPAPVVAPSAPIPPPAASVPASDPPAAGGERSAGASPAVAADPDAERRERIAELLYGAGNDLEALRLMSPAGANAHDKYQEILALEPGHPAALRGIEAISDRYLGLAWRDLDRNALDRAARYIDRAGRLTPGRAAVADAQAALDAKRRQTVAGAPEPAATPASTSRIEAFRRSFDAFVREQKVRRPARDDSRARQFKDRLGGN